MLILVPGGVFQRLFHIVSLIWSSIYVQNLFQHSISSAQGDVLN